MATSLITEIPIFVFTSQIGDIELSTDQAKIEIVVQDSSTVVFKTMLYAYNGKVTLVNIGEVLESYMVANDKVFIAFTVYYNTADSTYIGQFNINTQYCSLNIDIDAALFGSYNFLTTLTAKRVPRNAIDYIWLLHGQDSGVVKAHCVYEQENGEPANMTVAVRSVITDDLGVMQIIVNQLHLLMLLRSGGASVKKLLSFAIEFNNRYFTYYVTDYDADVSFVFKNCFNVDEIAYFNAVTTTKTKVNRSMAVVGGRQLFYDQSVDKSYEVESAPLTNDEAYWVEQLLMSHSVRLNDTLHNVIITDSTCEMSDSDEQLNKVKFTWQFAVKTPHLMKQFPSDADGIFTEPYNATFN